MKRADFEARAALYTSLLSGAEPLPGTTDPEEVARRVAEALEKRKPKPPDPA